QYAADDNRIVRWDARRVDKILTWLGLGTTHGTLLCSPDGHHLVSSFGFSAGNLLRGGYSEEWALGNALAMSPDRTRLAAVTSDGEVTFHRPDWRASAPAAELIARRRAHQAP